MDYEEYLLQPEGSYNLIEGHLYTMAPPSLRHQEMVERVFRRVQSWVSARRLGWVFRAPLDVVLTPLDVVRPDVLFVARAQRPGIGEMAIHRCPDLVVEVLSPSTLHVDGLKISLYEAHGAREVWKVDPDARSVEVWRSGEVVLPGFRVESCVRA